MHDDSYGHSCVGEFGPDAPPSDGFPGGLERCATCGAVREDATQPILAYGTAYIPGVARHLTGVA